jgi:5-formyltetrahydrofolate cyclo-ligase
VEARSISVYLSMPTGEIQTDAIVRDALHAGKQVYIPYLHKSPLQASEHTPSRVMDMVRLKSIQDYESLTCDRWGIPSIDPSTAHERQRILGGPDIHRSDLATLDLVLMPGVAFDIDGATGVVRRLGHGKGFYDFFVQRYSEKAASLQDLASTAPLLYGLALTEQLLSSPADEPVPVGPLDRSLNGVLLGDGQIKLG